jgi:ribosomal protein S16
LLCCAGAGSKQFHPWIPVARAKKRRDNPIVELIQNYYPQLNSQELSIMLATITQQQVIDLAVASGYAENKVQELVKLHSAK